MSKIRAEGVTKAVINQWIDNVSNVFVKQGLDKIAPDGIAKRLWNADETGLCLNATSKFVLARRGTRAVYEVDGGCGREFVTVLGCGAADGMKLPPFVVYKAKNLWARWTKGGPAGTKYTISDSGWMEEANFFSWFEGLFIPSVTHVHLLKSGPVILFVDGHGSHIGYKLVKYAMEKGVIIMCLPPHTRHVLQPLDISCYGPLKQAWRSAIKAHSMATGALHITRSYFQL